MLENNEEITVCGVKGFMGIHILASGEDVDANSRFHHWISRTSYKM